jgi:flagellar motor component MotA
MSNKKLSVLLIGLIVLFILGRFAIPMLMSEKDTGAVIIAVSAMIVITGSAIFFINNKLNKLNKLNQLKKEKSNEDE